MKEVILKKAFYAVIHHNIFLRLVPEKIMKFGRSLSSNRFVTRAYNALVANDKKQRAFRKEYYKGNIKKFKNNYIILSDEKSRQVYKSVMHYRLTSNTREIQKTADNYSMQYIDELIKPTDNEVFFDVGACFGETSIDVYRYMKKNENSLRFKSVVFEPDVNNFLICKEQLKKQHISFIAINKAVSDKVGREKFSGGLFANSHFEAHANELVDTTTIDEVCHSYGVLPTYIKMDIEGAERKALEGAKETILKCKPKMAISIYHSDRDFLEIIDYISRHYSFYQLYVRHYSLFFADTVLYCIPKS